MPSISLALRRLLPGSAGSGESGGSAGSGESGGSTGSGESEGSAGSGESGGSRVGDWDVHNLNVLYPFLQ